MGRRWKKDQGRGRGIERVRSEAGRLAGEVSGGCGAEARGRVEKRDVLFPVAVRGGRIAVRRSCRRWFRQSGKRPDGPAGRNGAMSESVECPSRVL